MRDVLIALVICGLMLQIPKRPAVGVMTFAWLSLMNPHRLTYGFAFSFPWVAAVGGLTLVSLFMRPGQFKLPRNALVITLILFMAWMTITTPFAFEQERAWGEWNRVMKTLFFALVTMGAINNTKDTRLFALVVILSLGFYGFKGGLFTIMSGGSSRVMGPTGTYIADNNDLALALLTIVPLVWYLYLQEKRRWLRWGWALLALLTIAAVLGSYSRGALLGFGAMLVMLWLKSRKKMVTGTLVLLVVPLVVMFMPEQWFGRMNSIGEYKEDGSAMGRVNAWRFAINIASDNFMGGGFLTFTPRMFRIYAPDPNDVHAPHSLYFQVLGEHGIVGLILFLVFLFLAWRTGSRVMRFCKNNPELKWASDLAAMCQVSLLGYCAGGAFLTLAYADLLYDVVIILVLLEKVLISKDALPIRQPAPAAQSAPAALESRPA
ncbi:putative O-glycosylation ligase, exosortase A system-associated [Massilia norwichensis]|jgi:putative inorganic carbon (hco3(-)) transporter|uniref:O-glycosylation ligase, exosortase A system-associated n=1 Tax=Massilia norwichensis TaxID=1442366 RepID=A0ABT2A9V4_9BURK|nr:putative O-glycosylation ligase, exosortase A system-associated [Massilia norwichensis]MCS0590990.1 putative O-glycosylation ligase, exosortase A system-associated [Massilia norwichensis]